jgi:5'-nucleotidase
MRIVLTNDDGIDAPGLLAARQALEKMGDVLTVAPDRNRSGVGRSITFGAALHVEERDGGLHFEPVADFTARLAKIAFKGLPPGRILNVNAPNVPKEKLTGARVTRLGRRFYKDELIEVRDEAGKVAYDIYNNPPGHHDEEGTDFAAIGNGEISVTPVHLELTDDASLQELCSWGVESFLEDSLR